MPELELEYNARADMDEYANVMQQIHDTVPDPHEEQRRRNEIWDPLIELVGNGVSTGWRTLDRMILSGVESVDLPSQIYIYRTIRPSPEEHFYRQDPGEQGCIFRSRLVMYIEDHEFDIEVLDRLAELGRNVLAGRAVCKDHPLYCYCTILLNFKTCPHSTLRLSF